METGWKAGDRIRILRKAEQEPLWLYPGDEGEVINVEIAPDGTEDAGEEVLTVKWDKGGASVVMPEYYDIAEKA
jgi:hypothetical protein